MFDSCTYTITRYEARLHELEAANERFGNLAGHVAQVEELAEERLEHLMEAQRVIKEQEGAKKDLGIIIIL